MFSHTVAKKLLERFAYDDPRTKSKRLWRYQKGLVPWWKASPKTATAWDGHFADPGDAKKEEQLELRLKQEFEDPVNSFIDDIDASFSWSDERVRLLTGYIRMLFTRSKARQGMSGEMARKKVDAARNLLNDEQKLGQIALFQMKDLIERGLWPPGQ